MDVLSIRRHEALAVARLQRAPAAGLHVVGDVIVLPGVGRREYEHGPERQVDLGLGVGAGGGCDLPAVPAADLARRTADGHRAGHVHPVHGQAVERGLDQALFLVHAQAAGAQLLDVGPLGPAQRLAHRDHVLAAQHALKVEVDLFRSGDRVVHAIAVAGVGDPGGASAAKDLRIVGVPGVVQTRPVGHTALVGHVQPAVAAHRIVDRPGERVGRVQDVGVVKDGR